jgi:hypothetical protein
MRPLLLLALLLAACDRGSPADRPLFAAVDSIASPAGAGSGEPNLAVGADGRVHLTWLEPGEDSGSHRLRLAMYGDSGWSTPRTIAASDSFFVNWADFPSLLVLPTGRLASHWLARSGAGKYAYDVRIAFSEDGGATWSAPVTPHRDGVAAEHGFVSLWPEEQGVAAAWLDGRKYARPEGEAKDETMLASTILAPGGAPGAELRLDGRICDCCQTAVAITADGPVLVYRDRSPAEIRDIAVVRRVNGQWTEPRVVHADGWRISACPVNGPAIDAGADGRSLAVAWFTGAADTARVRVAFSTDAGATFGDPVRVDAGNPAGRVDVELLDDGTAVATWVERAGEGAEVLARRVWPDGRMGVPATVARSSAARTSGFPRMARAGSALWLAWTDPEAGRVRVARARLADAP